MAMTYPVKGGHSTDWCMHKTIMVTMTAVATVVFLVRFNVRSWAFFRKATICRIFQPEKIPRCKAESDLH